MTRHTLLIAVAGTCLTTAADAGICDPAPIDEAVEQFLADFPGLLDGACLVVGDRDGLLYEGYFGAYGPETVLPLASASKLVSAVAVMTLIDSGEIDPHAPIVAALPDMFDPGRAGPIKPFMTVDQMYSMTCGLAGDAGDPILSDLSLTLEEAADLVATTTIPDALPGTELNYTGLGMHVTGYLCEVVSGRPFDAFFAKAVSEPLNTPSIGWEAFGPTLNFRPSGGGESTARDYARILRMLARGGELGGVRLLSPAAVESMYEERTVGLPVGDVPPDAGDLGWGYAFGMWVEQRDDEGRPSVLTSPGAYGATPWIDLEDGYWGVFLVEGWGQAVRPGFFSIRDAIEDRLIHDGCRPCPIDFNHDGLLDLRDIGRFTFYGSNADPRADINANAIFDLGDVNLFVELFLAGCV